MLTPCFLRVRQQSLLELCGQDLQQGMLGGFFFFFGYSGHPSELWKGEEE